MFSFPHCIERNLLHASNEVIFHDSLSEKIYGYSGTNQSLFMKYFVVFLNKVNEFLSSQEDGAKKGPLTVEQVAMGFITVANETMCRPIRALTEARGHDTARHVLACFGGAGGQHACSIARSLGMSTVFIHR